MKVALAAMVYAAAAVRAASAQGSLMLVFTADEEAGSVHGSQWLAESGRLQADAAVIGEPCGIVREWESIDILSRGAALFRVIVHGTQMHSSISDRLPMVNATVMMARLMDRMDRELKQHLHYTPHPLVPKGPTLNVGVMVKGGVFYGVNPGLAEFACDLRTLPGMSRGSVEHDIGEFLKLAMRDTPTLNAELCFENWVPATELDPAEPIVAVLQDAALAVLGEVLPIEAFPGSTDATHFQLTAGIPTVPAFGPGYLPRAHGPNESLSSAGALQAAKIYALAAMRYLGTVS
jgi:acetylornithine deacetylase